MEFYQKLWLTAFLFPRTRGPCPSTANSNNRRSIKRGGWSQLAASCSHKHGSLMGLLLRHSLGLLLASLIWDTHMLISLSADASVLAAIVRIYCTLTRDAYRKCACPLCGIRPAVTLSLFLMKLQLQACRHESIMVQFDNAYIRISRLQELHVLPTLCKDACSLLKKWMAPIGTSIPRGPDCGPGTTQGVFFLVGDKAAV